MPPPQREKNNNKSGRQKWGGLGEEARARETGRENHTCQINDESEEGCCANCIASPTHLAYQGERGGDRVVTGLGNIEPILDPVYIEAMVERLLRVQCALYTVCFTHPRDQVRSAGPLNQFLIVLSSSPNFSKTLYLHQPKHDGGVSSYGDGGGGEGLGVNGVVFVGMVWIFYVRACVRRKGWKGEGCFEGV